MATGDMPQGVDVRGRIRRFRFAGATLLLMGLIVAGVNDFIDGRTWVRVVALLLEFSAFGFETGILFLRDHVDSS